VVIITAINSDPSLTNPLTVTVTGVINKDVNIVTDSFTLPCLLAGQCETLVLNWFKASVRPNLATIYLDLDFGV